MSDLQQLTDWCFSILPGHVSAPDILQLQPVSGDAGFRNYFRLNTRPTLIAVHAPPEQEDVPGFVDKALFFSGADIHVPRVYAVDYAQGHMLIEDLGDTLLLDELNPQSVDAHYQSANILLLKLQNLETVPLFEPYNSDKLAQEMQLFPEWFVNQLLQINVDDKFQTIIEQVYSLLIDNALQQPQVIVHRDYHARNLMLQADGSLGVIDFQDAVVGAVTYDLVSLLRDCYIRWPAHQVEKWAFGFYRQATALNQLECIGEQQFLRWFNLMGLQRHIKVLGIFARLWLRDGKPGYLKDLPLVMRYVLEQTATYEEFKPFHQWLISVMLPVAKQQYWYQPWERAGENL